MTRLVLPVLIAAAAALSVAGCRLEQRTVPPDELPIGCQVDADCAEGRWCDRGQCEAVAEEPDPAEPADESADESGDAPAGEGEGEGTDGGEGEGEGEAGTTTDTVG